MSAPLDPIRESSFADSVSLREAAAARIKAGDAAAAASSGTVQVVGSASSPPSPALAADQHYSTGEDSRPATGLTEGSKASFLKRASCRIRRRWAPAVPSHIAGGQCCCPLVGSAGSARACSSLQLHKGLLLDCTSRRPHLHRPSRQPRFHLPLFSRHVQHVQRPQRCT